MGDPDMIRFSGHGKTSLWMGRRQQLSEIEGGGENRGSICRTRGQVLAGYAGRMTYHSTVCVQVQTNCPCDLRIGMPDIGSYDPQTF